MVNRATIGSRLAAHAEWVARGCVGEGRFVDESDGADLIGANLWGKDLRWASLCGVDLCGEDLGLVNLRGANLWMAELRGVNLRCADLEGATLREADLTGADLSNAHLGPRLFSRLQYTDLRGILYHRPLDFGSVSE